MHVIARGALIGGGVGAALAVLRGGEEAESGTATRYAKSIAEGAVAGAGVGLVLDRKLRGRAAALVADVADRAPGLVETVTETLVEVALPKVVELAGQAYDTARPRAMELAGAARDAAEQAYEVARPHVIDLTEAARERAALLRSA